jgi:YggT family protein
VNLILCNLAQILSDLVWVYTAILLIYAVVSWFPDLRAGRWTYYLAAVVEPVLAPIRRIIPPMGGLDIAFLVLLLILQLLVRPALAHVAINSCFLTY